MPIDLSSPAGISLALLPEIILTVWAAGLLLLIGWRHHAPDIQRQVGILTVVGIVVAMGSVIWLWRSGAHPDGLPLMLALDGFRWATGLVFLLGAAAAAVLALGYLERERILVPEFYPLLLFATIGMLLMGGAADLIMVFLGLEFMSLSVYVLAGIRRRSATSAEAALKYFLLGAFASGFLLYGIALIYGATGTTNLYTIAFQVADGRLAAQPMLAIGIALLLVGFGFKVSAVPFHMWAPDVYDGAPTPVTAFMAAAVKAAGFAALVRVALVAFGDVSGAWQTTVWWLAALTMVLGNLVALAQRRVKRMLAYSSIAHAGYLLVAVAAGTPAGGAAFVFYALAYTAMTVGAFAILAAIGRDGESDVLVDDLDGLATSTSLGSVCHDGVHAVPARLPGHGRLHWEVADSLGDGRCGTDDPGRRPGARQRRVGGLLPANRDGHVHEATGRCGRGRTDAARRRGAGCGGGGGRGPPVARGVAEPGTRCRARDRQRPHADERVRRRTPTLAANSWTFRPASSVSTTSAVSWTWNSPRRWPTR